MQLITATPTHLPRLVTTVAALAILVSLGITASAQAAETAKPETTKPPIADVSAASALTKADVEKIIADYLMNNGKLIMDSVDNYQRQAIAERSAEGLKANYDKLYKDTSAPFLGNKDGDVTLVEFFDYNCGYCKRVLPEVQKLVEGDKNLKVVFIDFPILGPTSETASRWALAAHKQGKYFDFHRRLMEHTGQIDDSTLRDIAKAVGLDVDQAAKDADSTAVTLQIEKNRTLGKDVGVSGTPAFALEDQFFPGAMPADELKKAVERARADKKKN